MIQVWGLSNWNYEIVINSDGKNHQRSKSLFLKMLRMWFPPDIYWRCPEVAEYPSPEFREEIQAKGVYLWIMKIRMVFKAIRQRRIIKGVSTE